MGRGCIGFVHPSCRWPRRSCPHRCIRGGAPFHAISLELLQRPVPLRTGIGIAREPVTTKSSDAQAMYNQGLAYLHSFVWIEAARSFHTALSADPNLAMAHLGLSIAFGGLGSLDGARQELMRGPVARGGGRRTRPAPHHAARPATRRDRES